MNQKNTKNIRKIFFISIIIFEIVIIGSLLFSISNTLIPRLNPFNKFSSLISDEPLYPNEFTVSNPEKFPQFILKPNYSSPFDGAVVKIPATTVRINSDGFREDKDYPVSKPKDVKRIVIMGDSYTFGWGVEIEDSWPKVFERMLNENSDKVRYEVLNFGVPGYNIAHEVELYLTKAKKYDPDYVIFASLSNDLINFTQDKKESESFIKNNSNLDSAMSERLLWEYRSMRMTEMEKNFSIYKENIKIPLLQLKDEDKNIILINLMNPETYGELLKDIADNNGWHYIDVKVKHESIHPLDHHPNNETLKKYAEYVYQNFTKTYQID